MFTKIIAIVVSVTIFGILFFLFVKKALKKRLDYYIAENNKKKNENS